ncbi:antiviral reverse transcriptase Drt3b [Photobacterium rosenbergii]|uniref:Antiviral reverse transcriptase Drt3b n=1 Tax=Photobacterium rosenbergii TaxID=294936 RepID=A0ABU3ZLP5_9GAMM|nr:antiviral reverse transcriptase Drt3b [Photobacterium rosenbergii]MDV5171048.1 antiviral reverse transcriptase Drt3b [Photobacterium rosenbergii]
MSKHIKLKRNDFNRILLTDVLPYELPFIFTNEGFYKVIKSNKLKSNDVFFELLYQDVETKPFEYLIKKGVDSSRKLYLIHPASQISFVSLYRDYNLLITHLCSKSKFSLRYPKTIASLYYEKGYSAPHKDFKDEGVELHEQSLTPKYASSFFKYKKYDFLYKFYDGYEFHKIERKFHCLFKFDIAKCFDSISTYMLANSLRGEDKSRVVLQGNNFESTYIKLMEGCNYGRKHGIVIGPEFSRIFSELILQSIDSSIKESLDKESIHEGLHYELKRYVDDYFLFFNSNEIKRKVFSVVKGELEKYKLYCNDSKSIDFSVPFITPVTSAKKNIQYQVDDLFNLFKKSNELNDKNKCSDEEPNHILEITSGLRRYNLIANRLIRDFKCIVNDASVDYSSVTGYFFTLIKIKVADLDRKYQSLEGDDEQSERLCRFLLIILELSFFIYAMDLRVRSTYLLSQIIIISNRLSLRLKAEQKERIRKKIFDESSSVINMFVSRELPNHVEILNLIIALKTIDFNYQIEPDKLQSLLGLDENCNYFRLMVGLFYIQNDSKYRKVKLRITKLIEEKISNNNIFINSESCHLFLDTMSCPYVTELTKSKVAGLVLDQLSRFSEQSQEEFIEMAKNSMWFIDWRKNVSIERLLMKKELRTPYGD